MKILVCGGREYGNYHKVRDTLYPYLDKSPMIIQGGARGADKCGKMFASDYSLEMQEFPADWNKYGKSAGYIRNKQMIEEGKPDLVIAFPGGRGTANMINLAKKAGVEVIVIDD